MLKILAEHYFGSMLVTDDHGRFLYVSDGTCRLLGVDRETLMHISIYDTLKGYCFATSASSIKTLETKKESLSNHTLQSSGKQVLALSRPHFGPDGQLQYVPTYSWDEDELYTLLEKFDRERNNVRNVVRFMQGTDKVTGQIIAESPAMVELLQYAEHVAAVDSTVILYGESGSGKEVFAKYIHAHSSRASQVFIPINCAAMPPSLLEEEMFGYERGTFTGGSKDGKIGLFEFADKGTIFLDEIGEMSLELQAKLLRILETGEIKRLGSNRIQKCDVRIIAATNRDLREMVKERTFRADLYYRLNVLTIHIPPLRERVADIAPLARHFLEIFNKKHGTSKRMAPALIHALEMWSWPGNVRELRNAVERMMVESQGTHHRHGRLPRGAGPGSRRGRVLLRGASALSGGAGGMGAGLLRLGAGAVRRRSPGAAGKMGLHLSTLYRKLEKLGLKPPRRGRRAPLRSAGSKSRHEDC